MPRNRLVILLLFALGTALLYFPVLGNGFLTDDYAALYRLFTEKRILYREFLRPLIDISFYFNWILSGLHPAGYYVFNLAMHALACYMVYRVALDLGLFREDRQEAFALTAGVLFLFYPFHSEGVVWLSGRLSSIAALFGLLAVHVSLTRGGMRGFWPALLFWVLGLFAYESIVVVPAMILVLEWLRSRNTRGVLRLAAAWIIAGILWVAMRIGLSGGLMPGYGREGMGAKDIVTRVTKVLGRCFLPPLENSGEMVWLFAGLGMALAIVHFLFWRKSRGGNAGGERRLIFGLEFMFLLSLFPAFAFGVSTRTSEGDRLLYFPSCVLCIVASALLFLLVERRLWRLTFCIVIILAGAWSTEAGNRRWIFASQTVSAVMDSARTAPGRVVMVNLPDEWEGAYIFRNNFREALVVNRVDPGKVIVPHFLMRLEYLRIKKNIVPERSGDTVTIFPDTRIAANGGRFRVTGVPGEFSFAADRIYYWDKFGLKRLNLAP